MPNVLNRKRAHRPRKLGRPTVNVPPMVAPITVTNMVVSTNKLTVTFDQVVGLEGVPQYMTELAPTPVSATKTGPTTVEITYSATIAAALAVIVPFEDPAVRNASGGFVNAGERAL